MHFRVYVHVVAAALQASPPCCLRQTAFHPAKVLSAASCFGSRELCSWRATQRRPHRHGATQDKHLDARVSFFVSSFTSLASTAAESEGSFCSDCSVVPLVGPSSVVAEDNASGTSALAGNGVSSSAPLPSLPPTTVAASGPKGFSSFSFLTLASSRLIKNIPRHTVTTQIHQKRTRHHSRPSSSRSTILAEMQFETIMEPS
mmetsp:Transcript_3570/g.6334  ORF Transcript_3570/g.6334 Transcript_3570/m.6334 type:complete len:202 (+) Transcript_3570:1-606(+)